MAYDNAAIGVGFHTGSGKLTLNDGSEYAFTADGYSLAGIGYSVGTGTGKVYNLRIPADFAGEYAAVGAAGVIGIGSGDFSLQNRSTGAIIEADSKESGLRVGLGGGFVTVKLGERLKAPPVAAVEPAPAKPMPAAVVAKPTELEIEFGFNKARVSLAIGKQLDAIVADWNGKPVTFVVVGHADTVGTDKFNMGLSKARAENVKKALVERGIEASRVTARGVGQKDLAVATPDETRLRANRRVVITISNAK